MINRLFSHLVCLTVLFSSSAVTFADWAVISEHWYGVTIDGAKSGWASKILEEDDQFYRTSETQNMTLSRAGIELEISQAFQFRLLIFKRQWAKQAKQFGCLSQIKLL